MVKQKTETENIKSQSAAATIAGVSRQSLNEMFKKGMTQYSFFTPSGQVDTSHPDWQNYLNDRKDKNKGKRLAEKKPQEKVKPQPEEKQKKKSDGKKEKEPDSGKREWKREHALTGGYDPSMFYPSNPSQLKSLTDIVAKNLEMRVKLGELIDREIVDMYVDKIAQGINQFVNLSRAVSTPICEKLDRIGMEREIEKIINPKVKIIIEQIIEACNKTKNIKV